MCTKLRRVCIACVCAPRNGDAFMLESGHTLSLTVASHSTSRTVRLAKRGLLIIVVIVIFA